jgi:formyltetrahydrofolate deformylase
MRDFILKVNCPDKSGLIYHISESIFARGLNIEKNSEFVNKEHNWFFFRAILSGDVEIDVLRSDLLSILPEGSEVELKKREKKDIVILVTKESHCLGDILIRYNSGELDANILAIISNHDDLRELSLKFDIPYHFVPTKDLKREVHEDKIAALLNDYSPDLIILAKYMRILSPSFVEPFSGKIINIHHSFLPAFIGANPYKQAYERGVKIIGATAHYVNNDLDEGPIIAQDVVGVNHDYSWRDMQKAGKNVEKIVLAKAIDLALEDRIFVYKNKTVIF